MIFHFLIVYILRSFVAKVKNPLIYRAVNTVINIEHNLMLLENF